MTAFRAATPTYNSTGVAVARMLWSPIDRAINSLLAGDGESLRSQARDLERRNPWARNAADAYVGNVVGTGIMPMPQHPDAAVRAAMTRAWKAWTDEADSANLTDFYGLQSLVCRTSFVAGEVLIRFRNRRESDGLTVPLQLQVLEPEHLPIRKSESASNGNYIRWGIEFNAIGKRIAYHLHPEHPGEQAMFGMTYNETRRVPASEVLHIYEPLRPGQQRGQTRFAAVMLSLYELEKYDRAELVRKAIAAMIAFFERDIEGGGGNVLANGSETDDNGKALQGIEPGSLIKLPAGKTIETPDVKDVGGMYPDFMRVQLRKIAAGLGLTYEMLTGDLTGVNYSSIRAGLLEFRRRAEAFQHQVMVFQFCRPLWRRWLDAAALAGVISASDYAANPELYLDVEWQPQAWPWVDPLKDAKAEELLINNLLKARSQTIKQTGYDPESVDEMIAQDQEREDRLKLRRRTSNGAATTDSNGQSQGEEDDAAAAA